MPTGLITSDNINYSLLRHDQIHLDCGQIYFKEVVYMQLITKTAWKIKNRNSCYFYQLAERLTNLTVSVSESVWPPTSRPPAGSDFKECYHHIGPVDVYVNFTCTSVAVGRYLYITIMINEPHVLTLCDVRVYGEAFSKYIASVLDIHSTYLTGCVTNHTSQSWF